MLWIEPPGRGLDLLGGLLKTIEIALGAYALGLTIGLLGALGKIHGNRHQYTVVYGKMRESQ